MTFFLGDRGPQTEFIIINSWKNELPNNIFEKEKYIEITNKIKSIGRKKLGAIVGFLKRGNKYLFHLSHQSSL